MRLIENRTILLRPNDKYEVQGNDMILRRDDAFMAVCELRTPTEPGRFSIGTGMFVSSNAGEGRVYGWIITATHVAKGTSENTQLVVSTKEGKAETLPLQLFGNMTNWRHHPVGDVSAFRIVFTDVNNRFMTGRFFPFDHFNLEAKPVSRDFELTAIGFPNGLGTEGLFSPLTFRSYASSGFLTLQRADTHTRSAFFCLENPSIGGYSGCPVFDLGYSTNGLVTMTKEKTWCHGIMHGTMSDNTGGKIAMVTPAFYLKDIIDVV